MSGKKRVAVLISGNGTNLQALIDACAAPDFPAEIVRVISNRPESYGLVRADKAGLNTLVIDHRGFLDRASFDAALQEALIECNAELVCLAGFMRLLTPEFTAQWEGRMINIHPSLLPAFKGLDTHKRAIESGVRFAGCTIHFVSADMDAGPIIMQAAVPVLAGDTPQSLAERVLEQEHRMFPQALTWLAQGDLSIANGCVEIKTAHKIPVAIIAPEPV